MNHKTIYNQLSPTYKTWTDLYLAIPSIVLDMHHEWVLLSEVSDLEHHMGNMFINYQVNKDFLKARVFDEMKKNNPDWLKRN